MAASSKDVIIIGGGLAGLSLAHQLKQSRPDMDILVLERNVFPVPEKTAKVGESTVEIGSRYLTHTLGLDQHFKERHLRKHGLRCFFGAPQTDFCAQDELGVSQLFGIPTYQIDRGAIENHLNKAVIQQGVEVLDGVTIRDIDINESEKRVHIDGGNGERTYRGQWIVDAAGRQALIKSKLNLARPSVHKGNAVWFRIDRQIKLDEWSTDREWQNRIVEPGTRWLSTNHLMGPGYWVWIIPLDNGATSLGIVMDDIAFSEGDFHNFEGAMAWLRTQQPKCAEAIDGADVLDYVMIRDYSLGCKQQFSEQQWAVTGEAGVFADPFYSPGSDFIAFSNSFINQLICDSYDGDDIRLKSRLFQTLNQSFFDSTLSLYTGQYGGFGDRRMMSLKLLWDYAYYWGVLSVLFFKQAMTDPALMRRLTASLHNVQTTNQMVQSCFRQRAAQRQVLPTLGLFMNQYQIPCLQHFNDVLEDDNEKAITCLPDNAALLERLSTYVIDMLSEGASTRISGDEHQLLGDYRRCVLA